MRSRPPTIGAAPRRPVAIRGRSTPFQRVALALGLGGALYAATIVALSRITAMEILRHRRWRLDERWPGVPFATMPDSPPSDFPAAVCQKANGLLVVGPPLGRPAGDVLPLAEGDVILTLDGVPATPAFAHAVADRLTARPAGTLVSATVSRDVAGQSRRIDLDVALPAAVLDPGDLGLPFEDIALDIAPGVRVRGWYIPPFPRGGRRAPALLYVHGRQRNRRHIGLTDLALPAHARGYGLLLIDLLGSGASDGATDFWNDAEIRHAVRFLRRRPELDPGRIGVVGVSFGGIKTLQAAGLPNLDIGALAIIAAADTTPSYVRLIVPPAELPALIRRRLIRGMTLPSWLVESGRPVVNWWFRRATGRCLSEVAPARAAAHVRCPVFLAHGTADQTFPLRSALRIFAAIPTQKVFHPVQGHDHFTTAQSGERLWRHLLGFFDEYLVSQDPALTGTTFSAPNSRQANGQGDTAMVESREISSSVGD